MTTGTINYEGFEAAIARMRNRHMLSELLDAFFWRAIDDDKLETAATIMRILDEMHRPAA